MSTRAVLLSVALLAVAAAGCEEFLEPRARVTGGQNSPTIGQVQAIAYNGPRARIAVATFDNKAGGRSYRQIGYGVADMLATELLNTNRYIVLERQQLGAVTAEQDLARSGRVMPGTGAPTGQIEGAELLVMGAITGFEPNYQGGGLGAIRIHRRHPGGIGLGVKQAYVAIDLRVVDARTSRIVAATTVEGKATDIAAGIGGIIGGGSSRLGIGLGGFRNTPMEKAVRACLAQAVQFVVSRTPANYYHFGAAAQPPPAPVQPGVLPPPPAPVPQPGVQPPPPPQPGAQPPPAAGALPAQVWIKLGTVRVYQEPKLTSATVATVTRGTALRVQAQEGDWYGIQLPNGTLAWVMKGFTSPAPVQ